MLARVLLGRGVPDHVHHHTGAQSCTHCRCHHYANDAAPTPQGAATTQSFFRFSICGCGGGRECRAGVWVLPQLTPGKVAHPSGARRQHATLTWPQTWVLAVCRGTACLVSHPRGSPLAIGSMHPVDLRPSSFYSGGGSPSPRIRGIAPLTLAVAPVQCLFRAQCASCHPPGSCTPWLGAAHLRLARSRRFCTMGSGPLLLLAS